MYREILIKKKTLGRGRGASGGEKNGQTEDDRE